MTEKEPPQPRRPVSLRDVRSNAGMAEKHADRLAPTPNPSGQEHDRGSSVTEAHQWFHEKHERLFHLVTNPQMTRHLHGHPRAGRPAVEPWQYKLAVAVCTWYEVENRLDDWEKVCDAVLGMKLASTDPAVAFWAHNELAVVYRRRGQAEAACRVLLAALLKRNGGGRRGLAQAKTNLGLTLLDLGEVDEALEHLQDGLRLRSRSDRRGQARSELALGTAYWRADELDMAHRHLSHAVNRFHALGDVRGMAVAHENLSRFLSEHRDQMGADEHRKMALAYYHLLADDLCPAAVPPYIADDLP